MDKVKVLTLPLQFLSTNNMGNLPSHAWHLRVDAPIIILKNIDPGNVLCSGIRLICKFLKGLYWNHPLPLGHEQVKQHQSQIFPIERNVRADVGQVKGGG